MMRKYMLIVVLFALFAPVYAQEKQATLFPTTELSVLEADDVFTDNVDVIQTLPELNSDGINKVLYYLAADSESWEILTPPYELSSSLQTDNLPNGNFEVSDVPSDMAGPCPEITPTFEFNPTTRMFTRQPSENPDYDARLYWGLFYSNPPENIRLRNYCQLDMFGAEMPTDVSDLIRSSIENGGHYPHVWTNQDYLVVSTPIANDKGQYLFAVYTTSNDTWGESFPLSLRGDWEFRDLEFKANILYFVAAGETKDIYYKLDITHKTFDELFRTPYVQPVFSKRWSDFYYYIGYDDTYYIFYRYDLLSEQQEVIAKFPCIEITNRCEMLTISDTNLWTKLPNLMFVVKGVKTNKGIPYFVLDIPQAKVLYKGLFPSDFYSTWREKKPSLIIKLYENDPKPYTVVIDFNPKQSDKAQVILPYRVDDVSDDNRRAVVHIRNAVNDTQTFGIVDLKTLSYTPVMLPLDRNRFDTSIFWRDDGTLQVTVYSLNLDGWWSSAIPLRTWIIQA